MLIVVGFFKMSVVGVINFQTVIIMNRGDPGMGAGVGGLSTL